MRHSSRRHAAPRRGLPRLSPKRAAAAGATVAAVLGVQAVAGGSAWATHTKNAVSVSSLTLSPTTITVGTTVTATAVVSSTRTISANSLTVAVRSASGADYDFPGTGAETISSTPLTFTPGSRSFPTGTYTYFVSYDVGGVWHALSPVHSFTVGDASAAGGATPSSTSAPAPSPTSASTSSAPTSSAPTSSAPTSTASSSASTSTTTGTPSPTGSANAPTWSDSFVGENVPLGTWTGCSANGPVQSSHCTGLPANVDANWWAYPAGWQDTSRNGTYDPSKTLSIANGQLTIHLNRDSSGTWVGAPLPKLPDAVGSDGGQQYGTYSVTWKADEATPGFKLAWLLWPDSENWPGDGEIDFPEGSLSGSIAAFMHREGGTSGSDQDAYSTGVPTAGAWHTTVVDWEAGYCDFYLDGKIIGHSTSAIPNTPMHLVLQSETTDTAPAVGASADIHLSNYSYWKPGTWSPSQLGTTP